MKNFLLLTFFVSLSSQAQPCQMPVKSDSFEMKAFDLGQIANSNGLELRFESYLEKDLHLITAVPGKLKFVVSFADGTSASYPRKWCSLNFVPENDVIPVELVSDWESCKAIAFSMREYANSLNKGLIVYASSMAGSSRLKLEGYCTR